MIDPIKRRITAAITHERRLVELRALGYTDQDLATVARHLEHETTARLIVDAAKLGLTAPDADQAVHAALRLVRGWYGQGFWTSGPDAALEAIAHVTNLTGGDVWFAERLVTTITRYATQEGPK